jgi:hypothetical protein
VCPAVVGQGEHGNGILIKPTPKYVLEADLYRTKPHDHGIRSSPLMLAIDRRIFDIPLEERLQARTSDLKAWTKTMLPIIRISISEAQVHIRTGHQDSRTYFPDTAEPERNMTATPATATAMTATITTDRIGPRRTDLRQRPKQKRNRPATTSTSIRRSRYYDIRNCISGATVAVTTTHAMQTATEESDDSDDTDSSDDTDDRDDEFSVARKLSPVARYDPVKLVRKRTIQSPESGSTRNGR